MPTYTLATIRLALGDTDPANQLLSDAVITAAVTGELLTDAGQPVLPSVASSRALLALERGLVATYSQRPDTMKTADGSSVSYATRLSGWNALIDRLVREGFSLTGSVSIVRAIRSHVSATTEWG